MKKLMLILTLAFAIIAAQTVYAQETAVEKKPETTKVEKAAKKSAKKAKKSAKKAKKAAKKVEKKEVKKRRNKQSRFYNSFEFSRMRADSSRPFFLSKSDYDFCGGSKLNPLTVV